MPKEIIKDSSLHGAIAVAESDAMAGRGPWAGGAPVRPTRVEVGWQRGLMDVQIGSVNPEAGDDPHDPKRGWFVHLDREGVNRLIRSLRKARDQAFGADA